MKDNCWISNRDFDPQEGQLKEFAKSVQQITAKMKKSTPVLFVDLSAAFDHVERNDRKEVSQWIWK